MTVKAIVANHKRAVQNNRGVKILLNDLYRYVLPFRRPSGGTANTAQSGGKSDGSKVDQIFDSTAVKAAFRFAGRMEQEVTPAFQQFFELKTGPFLRTDDADQKKAYDETLETVQKQVLGVLEGSNFSVSMSEMYLDLFGGTGTLLMLKDEDSIIDFIAVPLAEVDLGEDGKGRVNGVYWEKSFEAGDLPDMWVDPKFPKDVLTLIKESPEKPVRVMQASEYVKSKKVWRFTVYLPEFEDHGVVYTVEERTSQWLTPRFYKVAGEAMGRGPGLLGLPTTKTLNKVTQLTIMAASLAIMGIWTYRNDRVFNPKNARLAPGAMWKVGSNGGPLGASISKLDAPGRFDVSNLVLQELRMMAKEVMLDDTLPPDAGSVRSATEIVERMKRLSRDLAGAYGRLVLEIIIPLVQRVIDALDERKLIPGNIPIDQLLFKVQIVSPIARSQQANQVQAIVEWLEIMISLGGPEMMMMTARVEKIFAAIGEKLGVSESFIRSEVEKGQLQQVVAQIIANAQAQAAAAAGTPEPEPAAVEQGTQQGARADQHIL